MGHGALRLIAKSYQQLLILLLNLKLRAARQIDHHTHLIGLRLAETHATHWIIVTGYGIARCSEAGLVEIDYDTRRIAQTRNVII